MVGCRRGAGSGSRGAYSCSLKGWENRYRGAELCAGAVACAGAGLWSAEVLAAATGCDRNGFTCAGERGGGSLGLVAGGSSYESTYLRGIGGGKSSSESLYSSSSWSS